MIWMKLYHEGGHEGGCCHNHDGEGGHCHNHGGEHGPGEEHHCCGHHGEQEPGGEHHCCGHHGGEEHHCCHGEPEPLSPDEKLAMLAYMIHHNGQHLEELHALRNELEGDARKFCEESMNALAESNEKLVYAFQALQKQLGR